ncbi:MAG: TrmH family RNA methyltransferase [Nitrospirota bacterium]|nr:TrmH family RNA methyltransferase [Nitrospirota bacterium]MDH5585811.1 TrmH family RNA methyltransferase [Nitrospirota bacterium]MDH5774457.1 TrmH family RNA methyltransferase [Nitrospirota bacterium]
MTHFQHISSSQNPQFKRWISLLESQGSKTHEQCLISGITLREEISRHSPDSIQEILYPPRYEKQGRPSLQFKHFTLTKKLFDELDVFGTHAPLMVCANRTILPFDLTQPPIGLEILCPIGDPGNLGALLRSCLAFGVRRVILLREAVHPFHPKVIRASSGAAFLQPLSQGCSMSEIAIPERLKWIIPLDMEGENIATLSWPEHVRLLIGEEGMGIPALSYAQRFNIPQIHSAIPLNATVASSLALYAYRQQHPRP